MHIWPASCIFGLRCSILLFAQGIYPAVFVISYIATFFSLFYLCSIPLFSHPTYTIQISNHRLCLVCAPFCAMVVFSQICGMIFGLHASRNTLDLSWYLLDGCSPFQSAYNAPRVARKTKIFFIRAIAWCLWIWATLHSSSSFTWYFVLVVVTSINLGNPRRQEYCSA